jgi:biotin-dependent carboxylase-like uncharacterized protein
VIRRHAAGRYTVGWLGFSPGFAYLTGLDPALASVPRLETPRPSVPAGSVAIAAGLAAVYPAASPGGWQLLGRTSLALWNPARHPAALLSPGQAVTFSPVPAGTTTSPGATPARHSGPSGHTKDSGRVVEVIRPGPLATVQDLGRLGLGALAVPPSGAADAASLIRGNRLVGNEDGSAAIELTLGRAAFRFPGGARVAVTGARAELTISGESAATGIALDVPAGALVSIGAPAAGLRSYLTVAGGIAGPAVLGSRSADLLSGLGGGPLKAGDVLPLGPAPPPGSPVARDTAAGVLPTRGETVRLRVIGGPRLHWFSAGALDGLQAATYTVTTASNRTGLRLDGLRLRRSNSAELPSEGMITGSLQVPPDGLPILLLADHPTTGGYPVIAVVLSEDLRLAAQLRPGDTINFTSP